MELCIVSHHSGLIDNLSIDGTCPFCERITKDPARTHYEESLTRLDRSILDEVEGLLSPATAELKTLLVNIMGVSSNLKDRGCLRIGLLARYLLSCLIDADRIDTARFMYGMDYAERTADWGAIRKRLEDRLDSFPKDSEISAIRRRISDECSDFSMKDRGLFTLTVPTGGGKTLSVFRFALNHLMKHGMRRIVFVAPYLSIIEQNAAVIEEVAGFDNVTECHSNVDTLGDRTRSNSVLDLSMDTWDSPIIFTSLVQLLNTFYASGTKSVRRLHNLANSIIIFDEVQSVPLKTLCLFNEAVSFLTKVCGSSVVMCTATQPALQDGLEYPLDRGKEIMTDVSSLFKDLHRTDVHFVRSPA